MWFNYERTGWEKIMPSRMKNVLEALYHAPDPNVGYTDETLAAVMSENKLLVIRAAAELEEMGLVESWEDNTMGAPIYRFRRVHTAKDLRKLIARRVLLSMIDEFGVDLLDVVIEELQTRPAAKQRVIDALVP
jgi:hypothetical protein